MTEIQEKELLNNCALKEKLMRIEGLLTKYNYDVSM